MSGCAWPRIPTLCYDVATREKEKMPQATRSCGHFAFRCYRRGPDGVSWLPPCGPGARFEASPPAGGGSTGSSVPCRPAEHTGEMQVDREVDRGAVGADVLGERRLPEPSGSRAAGEPDPEVHRYPVQLGMTEVPEEGGTALQLGHHRPRLTEPAFDAEVEADGGRRGVALESRARIDRPDRHAAVRGP